MEEVVIIAQVAEGRGRKVAMRAQLKYDFVAELGEFGVAVVTTNRIAGIGGVLDEGEEGVEYSSGGLQYPGVLECRLVDLFTPPCLETKEKVGNIWRFPDTVRQEAEDSELDLSVYPGNGCRGRLSGVVARRVRPLPLQVFDKPVNDVRLCFL
jgi:hypothetical protein